MDTKITSIALATLIIGAGLGYAFAGGRPASNGNNAYDMGSMHGQMTGMMSGLVGKTGDEFDKAFLSEMIIHHEGAVFMAEAALVNAKHEEIKQMAGAIISAQTAEIEQMKSWQNSWYGQ